MRYLREIKQNWNARGVGDGVGVCVGGWVGGRGVWDPLSEGRGSWTSSLSPLPSLPWKKNPRPLPPLQFGHKPGASFWGFFCASVKPGRGGCRVARIGSGRGGTPRRHESVLWTAVNVFIGQAIRKSNDVFIYTVFWLLQSNERLKRFFCLPGVKSWNWAGVNVLNRLWNDCNIVTKMLHMHHTTKSCCMSTPFRVRHFVIKMAPMCTSY